MNSEKLNQFAATFQSGGVAAMCLRLAAYKAYMADEASDTIKDYYENELPDEINARMNEDKKVDSADVVNEIENNLLSLSDKDREPYMLEIIARFADWSRELNDDIRQWMNKDYYGRYWLNRISDFGYRLCAMLLRYGMDLMRLQTEIGVYTIRKRNLHRVGHYLGSLELAKKYIDDIQRKREPQQEDKKGNKTAHFNSTYPDNILKEIRQRLIKNGFISASTTLEQWIYICTGTGEPVDKPIEWNGTQKTLAYFVGRYIGKNDSKLLWVIAENAFTYKGKKPNRNTMRVFMHGIKDITGYALQKQDKNIYEFSKFFSDLKI